MIDVKPKLDMTHSYLSTWSVVGFFLTMLILQRIPKIGQSKRHANSPLFRFGTSAAQHRPVLSNLAVNLVLDDVFENIPV